MMKYRLLGRSGLRVSELCLGTMTFGEAWGFGAPQPDCAAMFDAYCEAGGNFIDTASNYTSGQSECIVGKLIASDRDRYIVSTKYSLTTQPDDINAGGNQRKCMRRAVEQSLRRLGTDHIDVYWLHVWDGITPGEEVMRGLDDLVRAGKVLYLGISDTPAWVIARNDMLAELRGWSSFAGVQLEYSLLERGAERELLPMATALRLGVLAWAPLAGGLLTGKYVPRGEELEVEDSLRAERNQERIDDRALTVLRTLAALARELDRPLAQVALAWLRQQASRPIPILGARNAAQLRQSLGCLDVRLEPAVLARLDEVSRIDAGFPQAFLASDLLRLATFGDHYTRLELDP